MRHPDRRTFLKTTGAVTAGAALYPYLGCVPDSGPVAEAAGAARAGWVVRPFRLDRVTLGPSFFREKRDRMLHYARDYGSAEDPFAGPDRLLSIFRENAGLDTKGAEAVGGWETGSGYLRGHYAGHFMSMLAQAWAGTGDPVYKEKLDYMVRALAECQGALAEAARRPTPREEGRFGRALRLTGSPLGHAEHVRLPDNLLEGLTDFTLAVWVRPSLYKAEALPDRRRDPVELLNGSLVFDFGRPNPEYAEDPLSHMYLTVRASNEAPVPRFAITTTGEEGEQALAGTEPLPMEEWTHLAVTRAGSRGTLYVNGRAVATNPAMTLSPADLGATTGNWLGRGQFPQRTVSYLNAALDDVHVYPRTLTEGEVRALMEDPTTGGEDALAWYPFDEEGGPVALDASGNGRDAHIVAPNDGLRHPGFLSAYPETQFVRLEEFATYGGNQGIWAPYYTLHKIMAGLLDAHLLAENEEALKVLTGIGDWVWNRLGPLEQERLDRMWNIYIAGEYGGVNESLATLHALLPEKEEYLLAARRFDNTNVYGPTAAGEDVLDGRHANQHIPQFTGYLRIFEGNQEEEYLAAARNFWEMVVPHRIYAHGGMGVGEMFRERDVIAGSLFLDRNHAETCPLYNMLKLSRNLFFHAPDPRYMDYYELGLFNQMAGSRRDMESVVSPEVTYFVPVQPGQRRFYGNVGTCCGGTGMESHTKYQDSIYFRSVDDTVLFVNLYIPSALQWPEKGFTIAQETGFPNRGTADFTVEGAGKLEVRLRVPHWARAGFQVTVNGEEQALEAAPGRYVALNRRWRSGDRIHVEMPMTFRAEGTVDDPSVQALFFGPFLLAAQADPIGDAPDTGFLKVSLYRHMKLDGRLAVAMAPSGDPLTFTINGLSLKPFYVADPVTVEGNPGGSTAPGAGSAVGQDLGGSRQRPPPTQPYHIYLKRHEPRVVFGSVDAGVENPSDEEGKTLLDAIWDRAPFPDHPAFLKVVEETTREWAAMDRLDEGQQARILDAAQRAQDELAV